MDEYEEVDPAEQGKEELDRMDTNKDGKADLEELTAYMKAEFYQPEDVEEEGLTEDQVAEKSKADAQEYLDELDKNKDGSLDLEDLDDMDGMDEEDYGEPEDEEYEEEEPEDEE